MGKKKEQVYQIGDSKRIKDINFFTQYQQAEKQSKNLSKVTALQISLIGAAIITGITVSSVFAVLNSQLEQKIQDLDASMRTPYIVEKTKELENDLTMLEHLKSYYDNLYTAHTKINSHIRTSYEMIEIMLQKAQIFSELQVQNMSYGEKGILLECQTTDPKYVSAYTEELDALSFIDHVLYNGVLKDDQGKYHTIINVVLAEKEVENDY